MTKDQNRRIRELHARWKFNADLMTCQTCGYSIIATRIHEAAAHADGCPNATSSNPWMNLAEILDEIRHGKVY